MTYSITDKGFEATLKLNSDYRYNYFFTKIKNGLDVFILKKGEDILFLQTDDNTDSEAVLALWPHESFASRYASLSEDTKDYLPQSISLALFIEKWIPTLAESKITFAIFPLDSTECNIISSDDFLKEFDE